VFIAGNFIIAIAQVLSIILNIFYFAIIIRALLSWVNPDPFNPIVQLLNRMTDPILVPIRNALPFLSMGIDFSPIIAILAIYFAKEFLIRTLFDIATRMR